MQSACPAFLARSLMAPGGDQVSKTEGTSTLSGGLSSAGRHRRWFQMKDEGLFLARLGRDALVG